MKCLTCETREAKENTTLCLQCDIEEWRDAVKRANERFREAERGLRNLQNSVYRFLVENRLGPAPIGVEEQVAVMSSLHI